MFCAVLFLSTDWACVVCFFFFFVLKGWVVSGSPQSTLCALESGCGCRQGSSHGSPNGSSRVSSPPPTWDLLHAAAGEVERMRMNTEEGYNSSSFSNQSSRGIFAPPRKQSPISIPSKNPNPDVSLYPLQSLSYQKLQATQVICQTLPYYILFWSLFYTEVANFVDY